VLCRQPSSEALLPHEAGLLEALFQGKSGQEDDLDVSKVGQRLGSRSKQFNQPLDEEMTAAGLLDSRRKNDRTRLIGATIAAMLVGGLAQLPGLPQGRVQGA
jgi:hypothetical protein